MKKNNRVWLITVILLVAFTCTANAKTTNKKAMSLYNKFLSSGKTYTFKKTFSFRIDAKKKFKQKMSETINLSKCYFNAVDIDKNGVKELVVKKTSDGNFGPCGFYYYVFTIKSGKVKPVGFGFQRQNNSASIEYIKSRKALLFRYTTAGSDSIFIYRMKKGKIKKIDAYARRADWETGKSKCYKNGKKISVAKYIKQTSNIKTTNVKLFKNTLFNRNTILQ